MKKSAVSHMAHRVAKMLEGGLDRLLDEFRAAHMKHADETTWSCDGKHGCAWGFFTPTVSLYRLRGTRGSVVAKEVFGDGPHVGVLGVDRYAAYGKVWLGTIQYCMEHYKRNVGDLLEAEPENKEYKKYIPKFIELLKEAMTLRSVIDTLKLGYADPVRRLSGVFDALARNRDADVGELL